GAISGDGILRLAASAEKGSEHPLGEAIVRAATAKALALEDPRDFLAIPGQGVRAAIGDRHILLGNRMLMASHGIPVHAAESILQSMEEAGKRARILAVDEKAAGVIAVSGTCKEDSLEAVRRAQCVGGEVMTR